MDTQTPIYSIHHNPGRSPGPESGLEKYFSKFRGDIIGHGQTFESLFGKKELLYADWTASGRCYRPIEEFIQKEIMPFVANTHTEGTVSGTLMSKAYEQAKTIVKGHVQANNDDVLIFCGSGMTGAVNKLQRILGLRMPERIMDYMKKDAWSLQLDEMLRPVVFVSHMEHHSNHLSWLETIATVEVIKPGADGNVDLVHFQALLDRFKHRKNKIAAITACSNVTGIETPYREIAKMIHACNGLCVVDCACSAPYTDIDMHPAENGAHLDAIYFSPHKFLGGPGTPGVLIFNKILYNNTIPDQPGGGTVMYTNPWRGRDYVTDIEQREDGGTPPFLQGIKAAMCIRLKEQMGVENIRNREKELLRIIFDSFAKIRNIEVLEGTHKKRLGVVSFVIKGTHYNLVTKILNDRFGIQARGGCSCAGTYGHMLLQVNETKSGEILASIYAGDMSCKPGWVRLSIHPTMTDAEIHFIMDSIAQVAVNLKEWGRGYSYDAATNEFVVNDVGEGGNVLIEDWFNASQWGRYDCQQDTQNAIKIRKL